MMVLRLMRVHNTRPLCVSILGSKLDSVFELENAIPCPRWFAVVLFLVGLALQVQGGLQSRSDITLMLAQQTGLSAPARATLAFA